MPSHTHTDTEPTAFFCTAQTVTALYANTDLDVVASALLGGVPVLADTELDVLAFWGGRGGGPVNPLATAVLRAAVGSAVDGRIPVSEQVRSRLRCLRAHGDLPQVTGPCVLTGPVDGEGVPTTLPDWFTPWLKDTERRLAERETRLLSRLAAIPGLAVVLF